MSVVKINKKLYEQQVENEKQVVLTNNIMLGEKLINVNEDGTTSLLKSYSECEQILKSEVKNNF